MKKIIAALLVASMGLSLFAGCGSGSSAQQSTDTASVAESSDESAAEVAESVAAETVDDVETAEVSAADDRYLIRVLDGETEEPIAGARVQLCSETQCMMDTTGADGFGVFEVEPGTYITHLLQVPEGYEEDVTSYELTADDRSVTYLVSRSEDNKAPAEEAADDNNEYQLKYNKTISFASSGLAFNVPEEIRTLKGQLMVNDIGEIQTGLGIYVSALFYFARTDEEVSALAEKISGTPDVSPELQEEMEAFFAGRGIPVLNYLIVREDYDLAEVLGVLGADMDVSDFTELGHANGFVYYCDNSVELDEQGEGMPDDLYEEYVSLKTGIRDVITEYSFSEPAKDPSLEVAGNVVSFETTDLEGNAVKSEDLFKDHKVTMINLWATTCPPCKDELSQLEEYNRKLAEIDCQIIGICFDTIKGEEVIEDAKAILEEKGVTYTNLVSINEFFDIFPTPGYPTTYFVGSDGTILTTPVLGADFDQYEKTLDEALAAVGE